MNNIPNEVLFSDNINLYNKQYQSPPPEYLDVVCYFNNKQPQQAKHIMFNSDTKMEKSFHKNTQDHHHDLQFHNQSPPMLYALPSVMTNDNQSPVPVMTRSFQISPMIQVVKNVQRKLSTAIPHHPMHYIDKDTLKYLKEKHQQSLKKRNGFLKRNIWLLFLMGSGLFFIMSLGSFATFNQKMIEGFREQVELDEKSLIFQNWKKLTKPVDSQYFVFGIKNPQQFLNGQRPIIEEHGPYSYKEYRTRNVIQWKEDTVVFEERIHFQFVPQESASLSEKVFVLNYPMLSILYIVKTFLDKLGISFLGPIAQQLMANVFKFSGEKILEQRTTYDVLEGRKVRLFSQLEFILSPLEALGLPKLELGTGHDRIRNSTYGFLWQRADIDIGPFEHFRRTENGHLFNQVYSAFGKRTNSGYRPPCNEISGSDGMFFGWNLDAQQIDIFNPLACRRLTFIRNGTEISSGISIIRYNIDRDMFNMKNKSNRCYCLSRKLRDCDGWSNMSPCTQGIPLGITWPHFIDNPHLSRKVRGLSPDPQKHLAFLQVEPLTGFTLRAKITIQVNILVDKWIPGLESVRKVLMPIMWISQDGGPGEEDKLKFRITVIFMKHGNIIVGTFFLLIASFNFLICLITFCSRHRHPSVTNTNDNH